MNKEKLAGRIRDMTQVVYAGEFTPDVPSADVSELLTVLARVLEGKDVTRAFGAPGDWGYGTPIGDALAGAS